MEEIYGKVDNGVNVTPSNPDPIALDVDKRSTRQYFGPDMALLTELGP
jgi:hypothetical protein